MEMMDFVNPDLLILVPVLYLIGAAIKHVNCIRDELIPCLLGILGVALTLLWQLTYTTPMDVQAIAMFVFTGIVQGLLVAGAAVYGNQIAKQMDKLQK